MINGNKGKVKKTKALVVLLLLFPVLLFCQPHKLSRIDSLLEKLPLAKEDTGKVNVLHQLSDTYEGIGEYTKALHYGNDGIELSQKLNYKAGAARCYTTLGNIADDQSEYAKALDNYFLSLKIYEELESKTGLAQDYNNIGLVYMHQSDFPRALDYFLKSLKENEFLNFKGGMANNYNNIGIIYMNQSNNKKALEYYFKSIKVDEELGDREGMAGTYDNIGLSYMNMENFAKAVEYYNKSLQLNKEFGDKQAIAVSYGNIGVLFTNVYETDKAGAGLTLNNNQHISPAQLLDSSMVLEAKALDYFRETGNKYGAVYSLSGIGKVLFFQKKYKEAISYFQSAYQLADSVGALKEKMEAAKNISNAYKKLNDWEKSLDWYGKYVVWKDSVFNLDKNNAITRNELKFEYEKKFLSDSVKAEEDKKVISAELKQEQTRRYALYGGLALVLVFAGFMYNRFKVTTQQKNIIELKEKETQKQKTVVEEKNKAITMSIQYALRIQTAILPPMKTVKQHLANSFILYKPKDIVAGDFYWLENTGTGGEGKGTIGITPSSQDTRPSPLLLFAACDCTGHGVPGAMVSVVCNNALNRAVREFGLTAPADILDKTAEIVIENFAKSEDEIHDGMDISLCAFNPATYELQWAGANNPLWLIQNEELIEMKPDKQPIGRNEFKHPFTNNKLTLNKGDRMYLFTDGYADQFGGPTGQKKLTRKRFKDLILSIQDKNMQEQGLALDKFIVDYRKEVEQIDDILIMGIMV